MNNFIVGSISNVYETVLWFAEVPINKMCVLEMFYFYKLKYPCHMVLNAKYLERNILPLGTNIGTQIISFNTLETFFLYHVFLFVPCLNMVIFQKRKCLSLSCLTFYSLSNVQYICIYKAHPSRSVPFGHCS